MADATKVRAALDDKKILARIGRELGRWDFESRELQNKVAEDGEIVFAAHAPTRSGRLARGIRARRRGSRVVIEAVARDPETGFDYVRVSRFGHRVDIIYPGQRGRSIFSDARFTRAGTQRVRPLRGARALRTPYGPKAWVRGFKPSHDWADAAYFEMDGVAKHHMEEFGRGVVRRIGST